MNFVDPKEYDIPGLVRKNRYRTILPSECALPCGSGRAHPHLGVPLTLRKTSGVTRRRDGGRGWIPREGKRPLLRAEVSSVLPTALGRTLGRATCCAGLSGNPGSRRAGNGSSDTVRGDGECFHTLCLFRVGRFEGKEVKAQRG